MFDDLLDEITNLVKKHKQNKTEFSLVYSSSITKSVINPEFSLYKYFQEILSRIENWINKVSRLIIQSTYSQCNNISPFIPLSGSFYIKLL